MTETIATPTPAAADSSTKNNVFMAYLRVQ
jgi:hypothetical protein